MFLKHKPYSGHRAKPFRRARDELVFLKHKARVRNFPATRTV